MMAAGRVLIVEDDEDVRDLVTNALADEGYRTVCAPDGEAALVFMAEEQAQQPDVIILDLSMPYMDGKQFAEVYRQLPGEHAPILVFSALRGAREMASQLGAADVITKPFDLDDLIQKVGRLTAARRLSVQQEVQRLAGQFSPSLSPSTPPA
jgi:CheY-like chemotaxis protein